MPTSDACAERPRKDMHPQSHFFGGLCMDCCILWLTNSHLCRSTAATHQRHEKNIITHNYPNQDAVAPCQQSSRLTTPCMHMYMCSIGSHMYVLFFLLAPRTLLSAVRDLYSHPCIHVFSFSFSLSVHHPPTAAGICFLCYLFARFAFVDIVDFVTIAYHLCPSLVALLVSISK